MRRIASLILAAFVLPAFMLEARAVVAPATQATPALSVIVARTLAQSDAQQKELKSMQFDQTANVEQLDDQGHTKRREVIQMIMRPGAHPEIEVISDKGDNVPASPEAARAKSRDVEDNKQNFTLGSLVNRFDLALVGRDQVGGQPVYVVSFTPKPGQAYRTETEKVVNQLQGRLWISTRTFNVLRTEAVLAHPVSVAWFLASIPQLEFGYTTTDSDAGFAPCQVEITLQVRAPLVGFHQRQTIDMANFRPRTAPGKPPAG